MIYVVPMLIVIILFQLFIKFHYFLITVLKDSGLVVVCEVICRAKVPYSGQVMTSQKICWSWSIGSKHPSQWYAPPMAQGLVKFSEASATCIGVPFYLHFHIVNMCKPMLRVMPHKSKLDLLAKVIQLCKLKGVLHPRLVFGLFLHFSQKLQHIGNK